MMTQTRWLRDTAMMQAARVIREHGYVPKSRAIPERGIIATAQRVIDVLESGNLANISIKDAELVPLAVKMRAESDDRGDYSNKAWEALNNEYVTAKEIPFLCAEISFAMRSLETKTETVPKRDEHYGTIGDRMPKQQVFVEAMWSYDSNFGPVYIVKMTVAGCTAIWKTSNPGDIALNSLRVASFRIKDHSEYKGEKQTIVSHLKWH